MALSGGGEGRPVAAGLGAGGVLVLVSAFLPWFEPVDAAYGLRVTGWAAGTSVSVALALGLSLAAPVAVLPVARRVPAVAAGVARLRHLARAVARPSRPSWPSWMPVPPRRDRSRPPAGLARRARDTAPTELLLAACFVAAGTAVLAVLLSWLSAPAVADPVLSSGASAAGSESVIGTVAGSGLFVGLAGTLLQLAACAGGLRRVRASDPVGSVRDRGAGTLPA